MDKTDYQIHEPFLQWLIGIGVLTFLLFTAWQQQLFDILLEGDQSRISLVILIAFIIINLNIARQVIHISRERNAVANLQQLLVDHPTLSIRIDQQQVTCCNKTLYPSFLSRHLINLNRRLNIAANLQDINGIQSHLLSTLNKRIHGAHKYGWLLADLMIKLGLLGTVIGFIFMLGSVATISDYDISTMQDLLRNMSGGMRVALFTTLSGLISGLILGIQYQFLDRQADELLADIEEISEVYILPALLNEPGQPAE